MKNSSREKSEKIVSGNPKDKVVHIGKDKVDIKNLRMSGNNLAFELYHPNKKFNNPFIIVNPPTRVKVGSKKETKKTPQGMVEVDVPVLEERPNEALDNIVKNAVRTRLVL